MPCSCWQNLWMRHSNSTYIEQCAQHPTEQLGIKQSQYPVNATDACLAEKGIASSARPSWGSCHFRPAVRWGFLQMGLHFSLHMIPSLDGLRVGTFQRMKNAVLTKVYANKDMLWLNKRRTATSNLKFSESAYTWSIYPKGSASTTRYVHCEIMFCMLCSNVFWL